MDPLSVTASVIAIAGAIKAAAKCVRVLQEVARAPDELTNLLNEASALHNVLMQIAYIVEDLQTEHADYEDGNRRWIFVSFRSQVSQADEKLSELDTLLQLSLKNSRPGEFEVLGVKWIQNRKRAKSLLEETRAIRVHLTTSLTIMNLSTTARVEIAVRHLAFNQNQTKQILSSLLDQGSARESPLRRMLTDAHTECNQHSNSSEVQRSTTEDAIFSSNAESQGGPFAAAGSGSNLLIRPISSQDVPLPKNVFSNSKHQRCLRWCSCVCHTRMRVTMSLPFGRLSVLSSGLPLTTRPCNEHTCRSRPEPTIDMKFYFPVWFWSRFVSVSMKMTPLCGPEINLKIPRVVGPTSSKLWKFVEDGDKSGIQYLFSEGIASPWDVNLYGSSALHYAVINGHFELCKFLLNEGADPLQEDEFHNTPASLACESILSNYYTPDRASDLALSFSSVDYLETMQLSNLHKTALNLVPVSLKSSLDCLKPEINSQDSRGRTCLSWVTARDDFESLQLLLQYGADPNIPDIRDYSPVQYVRSLPCAKLLVQYGANIMSKTLMGSTPLHFVSRKGHRDMIEWMAQAGADIDAMDSSGTPLMLSTYHRRTESAECLLRLGANPNLVSSESGWTALRSAVYYNVHDILRQLFSHGADHTVKSHFNETILHDAARIGDALTMEIISEANLSGLDPWAKDSYGKTARDYFNERDKEEEEENDLEDAFEVLLEIFSRKSDPDEEDVFYDASEHV